MDDLARLTARSSPGGLAWAVEGKEQDASAGAEGGWFPYPHLTLLSDRLMQVAAGQVRRLIVTMPPRHGKSKLISHYFPAWYLGMFPKNQVILASNTVEMARDFSRWARDTLAEEGPEIFGVGVSPTSAAAQRWQTTEGGIAVAAGIGGQITGRGANCLIIDDPLKDSEQAHSETIRDKQWNWWLTTARTRLMRGGSVIVVLTRWHEDDLAGRMLALAAENPKADQWEVLNLPALAEQDDPLEREQGEPLCPALMPLSDLELTEATSGPYVWSAMYQQRPSPAEGDVFQRAWFGTWDADKDWDDQFQAHRLAQSWDCTFKDTDGSDFVVGQLWACDLSRRVLVAQVRARLSLDNTITAARAMTDWARERFPGQGSHSIYVEDKANGSAVIAALKRSLQGVTAVEPEGGKLARAYGVQPVVAAGDVVLPARAIPCPEAPIGPRGKPLWLPSTRGDLIEEAAAFPNGVHDDQVDAMTQALLKLSGSQEKRAVRAGGYDGVGYADR